MFDLEVEAGEGLQQRDLLFQVEVGADPLEDGVVLDGNDEVDVTGHEAGGLVTLAVHDDDVLVGDSLLDGNLQVLLDGEDLLALAGLAAVLFLADAALALALGAVLAELLVHSGTEHDHLLDDAAALAGTAGVHVGAALAVARVAHLLTGARNVNHISVVGVFQRNLENFLGSLVLLGPLLLLASAASIQHIENIKHISTAAATSAVLETLQPVLVVYRSLVLVT